MHQNFGDRWSEVAISKTPSRTATSAQPIIALHCSGAGGRQWDDLAMSLGPDFSVMAPNLIGTVERGPWMGCHAFSLMDEAQAVVDLIDRHNAPVHLVGHSYGGGVALKVASERPAQVASLTLYEPSAFSLLRQLGQSARAEIAEIEQLAKAIGNGLVTGAYQQAAASFVDYWNGSGSWASLRPRVRDSLVAWLPKAPLDFSALLNDNTPRSKLTSISCPVLLLRGDRSPAPSRRIVGELARLLPNVRVTIVSDAGHMGPLTHSAMVNDFISMHVRRAAQFRSPQTQMAEMAA